MVKFRRLLLICTALFLLGFYFGPGVRAAIFPPGSEEDPLVTKSWVDNYLQEKFSPAEQALAALEQRVAVLESACERLRPAIFLTVGKKKCLVGAEERELDVPPVLISGRTMVPLRFVGEVWGTGFNWDNSLKQVSYQSAGGEEVKLTVGAGYALIGGKEAPLDVSAVIKEGRTLVPLRFIGESLGAAVSWDGKTKTVEIK